MKIPVFHGDQHGTAIVVGRPSVNGLQVVGQEHQARRRVIKLVAAGAGAAALACLWTCWSTPACRLENIYVTDLAGVVYKGRTELMDPDKGAFRARDRGAHAGRSDRWRGHLPGPVGRRRDIVKGMAESPLILATGRTYS